MSINRKLFPSATFAEEYQNIYPNTTSHSQYIIFLNIKCGSMYLFKGILKITSPHPFLFYFILFFNIFIVV